MHGANRKISLVFMSIVTGLLSIFGIPRYRGTFCEKTGHAEDKCFVKNRSELRNQRNVNLCAPKVVTNVDVVPAVVLKNGRTY